MHPLSLFTFDFDFEFFIRIVIALLRTTTNWFEFIYTLIIHAIIYFNYDLIEQHLQFYQNANEE